MDEPELARSLTDRPSAARMYDYFLGGYHNFEIDRLAAQKTIDINPEAPLVMRANRAFLHRVVRFLADQGIRQFLDIGSGMPTVGNVHEIAQAVDPSTRVVYADIEAVTVRHSEAILAGTGNVSVIEGDVREPHDILNHPEVARLLDFDKPVAVLLFCVLHFVPDDNEVHAALRVLRDAVAPGSYVSISHASYESTTEEHKKQIEKIYSRTPTPVKMRSQEQIEDFFGGFELVEPGLVFVPLWRPESADGIFAGSPERSVTYGGVGRSPA